MSGIKFEKESLKTQTLEAVGALAAYLHKPVDDGVLDLGHAKLVLNNRKDAYYVVTTSDCSCPARIYNPGKPCKHQRKHFNVKPAEHREESIRPASKWTSGYNGPVAQEMV